MEWQAHALEIGFAYDAGAIAPDGTERRPADPTGKTHRPTTRPGHRLPHARLVRNGRAVLTLDSPGRFTLLIGSDGARWWRSAEDLVRIHQNLDIVESAPRASGGAPTKSG